MQARGFLLGGTSGRTTLNGEGLQHEDGHSHIMAGTIPNCISYDPTFAHEVGVILHHGLKRMVEKQDNVFYYLTLLNENYAMPGLTLARKSRSSRACTCANRALKAWWQTRVQLLGSGTILRESIAAQALLATDWGVQADVWSCPSFNELTRDGQNAERHQPAAPAGHTSGVVCGATTGRYHRPRGGIHRLHEGLRRADSPVHPAKAAPTKCWAPMVLAAATSAANCASTSR
jgi:pyruvate dehydrogenase E1 component